MPPFDYRRITIAVLLGACSAAVPTEPDKAARAATCATDDECEVVAVTCGRTGAFPRDKAPWVRRRWEREAANVECQPAWWAPDSSRAAHCEEHHCTADQVWWPELRGCTSADECTVLDDPCIGRLGVSVSTVARARELMENEERERRCARRRAARQDEPVAEEPVGCRYGFCRP